MTTEPAPPADVSPFGRMAGPVLALGAVVAIIGALLFFGHHPKNNQAIVTPGDGNHHVFPIRTHSMTSTMPLATKSPKQHRHHAHGRPAPVSSATSPTTSTASPTSSTSSSTVAASGPMKLPVSVLNNSTYQGLAHQVAAEVEDQGWKLATIGNFVGDLPQTTVFYPLGHRRAAELLKSEFPKVTSVQPVITGLSTDALTLVLTRYWES